MWDPYADFKKFVLANGLEIFISHWSGKPWIKLGCIVHAGSFHDPSDGDGVAHFVEHLVSENAPVSLEDMEYFFQHLGGGCDFGSTRIFDARYTFKIPANVIHLQSGLQYFSDMLLGSNLIKHIEEERDIIIQEWHDRHTVQCFYDEILHQNTVVFDGFNLAKPYLILGSVSSLNEMSQSVLQDFYDEYYVPSNMSLVVVTGLPCDQVVEIIGKSDFGQSCTYFRTEIPNSVTSVHPLRETCRKMCMSEHGIRAIDRCLYRNAGKVPHMPNQLVVLILREMLNDMIFKEVRGKRGVTYNFASFDRFLGYFTEITFEGWVEFGAERVISDIVKNVINNINQKEELFDKIKEAFIQNLKMIDVNGEGLRNRTMSDIANSRRIISAQEEIEQFRAITFDDIIYIASFLSPEYRYEYIQVP
ncbi:MAG: hypothetical protein CR972_03350 [Candidatus Moraniibacteriota bacterium]|nr:MAG: hypothetical protein CR972_03350 [Candidatus Moranbacteria bacterium]